MKKKGFTLVELLAVIVILSVIAIITVPMILNVIENSRREATKITGNNYINYLEEHIAMEKLKNNTISDGEYEVIQDGKKLQKKEQTRSVITIEMNLKGKLPTSGSIIIKNGRVEEAELHIGKYTYTYKIDENGKSLVSITKDGQIAPENVSLSLNSKASSITATITCPDTKGSKAKTYKYKLNDKSWIEKNTNIHEFNKLKEKTEYKVTAQCINDTGGMTEVSETTTTKELENPTFEIKPGSEEEWASERTVTITYPTGEGLKYSYSLDKGTTWIDTEDKETKVKFKENGSIIAKITDGENTKQTASYSVTNIDSSPPSTTKPTATDACSSGSATISVYNQQKDNDSGTKKIEYAYKKASSSSWSSWSTSSSISSISCGTSYNIKTRFTNKAGISKESEVLTISTNSLTYTDGQEVAYGAYGSKVFNVLTSDSSTVTLLPKEYIATNVDYYKCQSYFASYKDELTSLGMKVKEIRMIFNLYNEKRPSCGSRYSCHTKYMKGELTSKQKDEYEKYDFIYGNYWIWIGGSAAGTFYTEAIDDQATSTYDKTSGDSDNRVTNCRPIVILNK